MSDPDSPPEWFEDFKKANGAAAPLPHPGPYDRRRAFPRFELQGVRVTLVLDRLLSRFRSGRNLAREALDLSEGGVRLQTIERVARGTRVRVRLEMEKFQDAFEAAGEVRWSYQGRDNGAFFAGIRFRPLDPAALRKISTLREWFLSPQQQALRMARRRQEREAGGLIFPK